MKLSMPQAITPAFRDDRIKESRTMTSSFLLAAILGVCAQGAETTGKAITDKLFHLGDNDKPDWKELTSVKPDGARLELAFEGKANAAGMVLELQAGEVGMDWKVKLNEKDLGTLRKSEKLATQHFEVPPSTLKDGKNELSVAAEQKGDDIYVGRVVLHERPLNEVLGYGRVAVQVTDADSGQGLPCRLTVVRLTRKKDKDGKEQSRIEEDSAEIFGVASPDAAVRDKKGIVYTKKGAAAFELAPGEYRVHASRGFEYSVAAETIAVERHGKQAIDLSIRREVDTTGYLAADTHVHTKTYSGHGDISVEERVVAIAGEGVEVAIATDHNHHTDYAPTMAKVGVDEHFSSIVGNEVTTSIGHFNAFPFGAKTDPPDHDHSDWTRLVQAMRAASGVRAVILNHPRRSLGRESPLGRIRYNPVTGEAHRGPEHLGLDGLEIFNGKTLEEDRMKTVNDWFGLLDRGYRVTAVAGSDSHSVDEIVGQARTYVASSSDDPRKLDIEQFCASFLEGRALVSLGLLARIEVDGQYRAGDLARPAGDKLSVKVRVEGPSWTRADRVALFVNGREVKKEKIEESSAVLKLERVWEIPAPRYDVHIAVVASGPPVTAPFWPISGGGKRYVMGVTNPVWIDGDRDGRFTSAFDYAAELVTQHGLKGPDLQGALAAHDPSVAAQLASIARARIQREAQQAYIELMARADRDLKDLLDVSDKELRKAFSDYLASAPKVEVKTREESEDEQARLKKEEADRKKRREEREKKRREEEEKRRREGRKSRV
jgi:hypothetical protein